MVLASDRTLTLAFGGQVKSGQGARRRASIGMNRFDPRQTHMDRLIHRRAGTRRIPTTRNGLSSCIAKLISPAPCARDDGLTQPIAAPFGDFGAQHRIEQILELIALRPSAKVRLRA